MLLKGRREVRVEGYKLPTGLGWRGELRTRSEGYGRRQASKLTSSETE